MNNIEELKVLIRKLYLILKTTDDVEIRELVARMYDLIYDKYPR